MTHDSELKKIDNTAVYSDYAIESTNRLVTTFLFHVTHIESAVLILKNNEIEASKIPDDPRLSAVPGVWLSPNTWSNGSIYGNVRFSLDAARILDKYKIYWLGISKWYNERTCNFMISARSIDSDSFCGYNIETADGPLRLRDGIFEINSSVNIHIVHDGSITADMICNVDTIEHSSDKCILKQPCSRFGKKIAERILIARCLRELGKVPKYLGDNSDNVRSFAQHLYSLVSHGKSYKTNGLNGQDDGAPELAKQIIEQYSLSTCEDDLNNLVALSEKFATAPSARDAIDLYIKKFIGAQYVIPNREEEFNFDDGFLTL